MCDEPDDVLMARVCDGDEESFAEIVRRYQHPLVNYLSHLARSRDRAEELAQEAFVRLYLNAAKYRASERLGPYLYRIATNLATSDARRRKRWTLLLPRLHASSERQSAAPDSTLLAGEIQAHVAAALQRLPLKFRAPLVLYEIEEWSYEDIREALQLPSGTLKSRISRAREMLRRDLAPWWIGENDDEQQAAGRAAPDAAAPERVAGARI